MIAERKDDKEEPRRRQVGSNERQQDGTGDQTTEPRLAVMGLFAVPPPENPQLRDAIEAAVRRVAASSSVATAGAATEEDREAVAALRGLRDLCGDKWRNRLVLEAGGITALVGCMRAHGASPDVQRWGCFALSKFVGMFESVAWQRAVIEAGGISTVTDALVRHRDSKKVQEAGCWALRCLVRNDDGAKHLIGEAGGVSAAVAAMQAHPGSKILEDFACGLLDDLTEDYQPNMDLLLQEDRPKQVLRHASNHSSHAEIVLVRLQGLG